MEILAIRAIEAFLLPPGMMLLLIAAGALLMGRFYALGKILVMCGFLLLLAASLPGVAHFNIRFLETAPQLTDKAISGGKAQAIIVLGGGRYSDAPEYQQDIVTTASLERLRYAAYLHKKTRLPVLVTGGRVYDEEVSEAELMKQTLEQDFGIKVRWLESKASNTWENAKYSSEILKKQNIQHAYLVTHAWHMPRAYRAFANRELEITPAPMGYTTLTKDRPPLLNWLPDSGAMHVNKLFLRELLGRSWYKLRY
ncbi:MAG: YdcF family protein [Thioalkalispiraceae bacterium]